MLRYILVSSNHNTAFFEKNTEHFLTGSLPKVTSQGPKGTWEEQFPLLPEKILQFFAVNG